MTQVEEVKVTRLGARWHVRLFIDGALFVEIATDAKSNIGWCCQQAMRAADKIGLSSPRTSASRLSYGGKRRHVKTGKVWWIWPRKERRRESSSSSAPEKPKDTP